MEVVTLYFSCRFKLLRYAKDTCSSNVIERTWRFPGPLRARL